MGPSRPITLPGRFLFRAEGYHHLDSLAAPQLVAVPAGHVEWPFLAEIPWLILLP